MVYTVVVHFWTLPGKEAEMKQLLVEASQIYCKDEGTLDWLVMQDTENSSAWTAVERYEEEGSLKVHLENPYFKKFFDTVGTLFEPSKPPQILRHNELDTSTTA
ncbi:hypothetical protein B0H19DRAFT_1061445 [Mycena capillaripes]|nr:hypothetical protein B0H19DRAFT_1061445 [Mycena capillaripes]